MTFGLYDTFANSQGCHIIRKALYLKVMHAEKLSNQRASLSPDPSLPLVSDDVRRERVLDVDVEPQEILLRVLVEVVVQLRRGRNFPPVVERGQDVISSLVLSSHSTKESAGRCFGLAHPMFCHLADIGCTKSRQCPELPFAVCASHTVSINRPYLMSWQVSSQSTTSRLSQRVGNSLSSTPFFILNSSA